MPVLKKINFQKSKPGFKLPFYLFFSKLWRTRVVTVFLLLILNVLAILSFKSDFLRVKYIDASDQDKNCLVAGSLKKDPDVLGKYLFLVDKLKIENKLKLKNFCLDKLEFGRELPNTLKIKSFAKTPAIIVDDLLKVDTPVSSESAKLDFSVNDSSVSGKFVIDDNNFIFSRYESIFNSATPSAQVVKNVYLVNGNLKVGDYLDFNLIDKIKILKEGLARLLISYNYIIVDNKKLLVNSEPKLVFSLSKDFSRQIASLQLILEKARMNSNPDKNQSKNIDLVDLRFDKPVVIYTNK